MNAELKKVIDDFLSKVKEGNELLKKYLNTDEPHNWSPPNDQIGVLGGKYKYFFHGIGCRINLTENDVIDFDYGSNGRIDGFDEWRLLTYVEDRQSQYPGITAENIKLWLKEAKNAGEIERPSTEKYGSLLFFKNT